MITLLAKPLRTEGRVLIPTGSPIVIDSDYLNVKRAVVEECHAKGWTLSSQSAKLRTQVAGESPLAVAKTGSGMLMGIWRVGGGPGRLILLTHDRNFIEWGPGCAMGVEKNEKAEGWSVFVPIAGGLVDLGVFASEKQARAVRALWLDAIINAPYGGLLRYDDETESVVDELAPDEDVFAGDIDDYRPELTEAGLAALEPIEGVPGGLAPAPIGLIGELVDALYAYTKPDGCGCYDDVICRMCAGEAAMAKARGEVKP